MSALSPFAALGGSTQICSSDTLERGCKLPISTTQNRISLYGGQSEGRRVTAVRYSSTQYATFPSLDYGKDNRLCQLCSMWCMIASDRKHACTSGATFY